MKYITTAIILLFGIYPISYGRYQWKNEKNKLGAFGTIIITAIGVIFPVILLWLRP